MIQQLRKPDFGEVLLFWIKPDFVSFGDSAEQVAIMH